MTDTQLPGVFGDLRPLLERYGYLAVGGFVLLEDVGVPVPGETMLIAALIVVAAILITRRVRSRRARTGA